MKLFKKLIAVVCTAAIALSITGCADISTMGTIDGTEIKAGVYLWYEQAAIQEARTEIDEQLASKGTSAQQITNFNYADYNVQEKPYSQFVEERTLEFVKQYVAVQRQFDELKLTLTEEEKAEIKDSAKSLWNTEVVYYGYSLGVTYGENYESLGISRQSYESVKFADKMSNKVFDIYYDKNSEGVTQTDEKDIKTYFNDNFGRFQVIQVALTEGNGDKIDTDEGKAAMKKLAEGYLAELKSGTDFDTVYHEYEKYVEEQKAKAEAEDKKESEDNSSSDKTSSNASSDETSSDTSSSDETSGDTSSDETSKEEEEEKHDHEMLIGKTDTSPSEEAVKKMFELKDEEGLVYEDTDYYYVAFRKPLAERTDWYDKHRLNILHLMKDEEFEDKLNETAKDYIVDFKQQALNAYKPDKVRV